MAPNEWQVSPVLGVSNVRQSAEYYRDVLGFSLDPVDGVFQPSADEPDGVYAIVKRPGAWIHFQRRGQSNAKQRQAFEQDVYLYVDDLDRLHAEFTENGALIVMQPRMAPYGIREMAVRI